MSADPGGDIMRDADRVADFAREAAGRREFNLSDVGNAERLIDRHGRDLRYAPGLGWLAWDGARFARDEDGGATRRMVETVRAMYEEALLHDDDKARLKLIRHALDSEHEARIRAALALAKTVEGVAVRPDELDSDPDLLNVANGTIDLRTGTLREPSRADLITQQAPVAWNSKAGCPRWLAFLDRVLAGDADVIGFLQRAVGYSLTGATSAQVLLILHGRGANGKTTFLETLRALLGEYGVQTPAETFLERRSEGIRNDVARLRGARYVAAVEMPEGRRLDEVLVKRLVGGDTITARFHYKEFFEFRPAFTPWVATNHRPAVRGTDEAIWRRLRLVPFEVTIPEEERDPALLDKLRDELPGILRWAVDGCLAWRRDGLAAPEAVTAATASYRAEEDIVGSFFEDRCIVREDVRAKAGDLYAAYQAWAASSGIRDPLAQSVFGRALTERGFVRRRSDGVRYWHGIGLFVEERDADQLFERHADIANAGGESDLGTASVDELLDRFRGEAGE